MEKLKNLNPDLFIKHDKPRDAVILIKNIARVDEEVPPKLVEYLKRRNKQSIQKHATKGIAFCFLTYGSIMHPSA